MSIRALKVGPLSSLSMFSRKTGWGALLAACIVASGWLSAKSMRFEQLHARATQKYGAGGLRAVQRWEAILDAARSVDQQEKVRRVNDFFNQRIEFMDDVDAWGKKDYWATPLETLGMNRGDCEDFSIAKYMTLILLDIPENQLRITYVKAHIGGAAGRLSQAHMVLNYYPNVEGDPLVLDNLTKDIRPAARRPDLEPIFSFNSEGLWFEGSKDSSGDPTVHLSRWRDVLARMREEGFN